MDVMRGNADDFDVIRLLPEPRLLVGVGENLMRVVPRANEIMFPPQLADRFLIYLFRNDDTVIVHDGHSVFYIRRQDGYLLRRADVGHILEAGYIDGQIVVRGFVIESMSDLLETSIHEYHLPENPDGTVQEIQGPQDISGMASHIRRLGKIVHARQIGFDLYVLEVRGTDLVLRHFNRLYGAEYDQLRVLGFDPQMPYAYFIEETPRGVQVVCRNAKERRTCLSPR
jgi:hypothetical protein